MSRPPLTPALEDYLEAVWNILRDHPVARVKDIAERLDVRMASASTAVRRLHRLGLVENTARSYVILTPRGELAARRVEARHELLRRFLAEVLGVSEPAADGDACALEHHLSPETVDRLVTLFEYRVWCRHRDRPATFEEFGTWEPPDEQEGLRRLATLLPGEGGQVLRIRSVGGMRTRLIDRGLLPGRQVSVLRVATDTGVRHLELDTEPLSLTPEESEAILLGPAPT